MPQPNRREALITIAAGAAVQVCAGPEAVATGPLLPDEVEQLATLVDTIIPTTETPGARDAGVAQMIAEDSAADEALLAQTRSVLAAFQEGGFFHQADPAAAMTAMMNGGEEQAAAFEQLKSLAVDFYYRTEVGLVDELGYQGATYLAEFPGCTHDHLTESA